MPASRRVARASRSRAHAPAWPWRDARYMPQVYPKNYDSLEAFRRHGARPKVCTVSYFDLPRPSHESGAWAGDLRARLGPLDGLVLTCVGPDENLDDFSAPDYHETAILVGASAVTIGLLTDVVVVNPNG